MEKEELSQSKPAATYPTGTNESIIFNRANSDYVLNNTIVEPITGIIGQRARPLDSPLRSPSVEMSKPNANMSRDCSFQLTMGLMVN